MSIVEEYDAKTLYPFFFMCYHYLHPMGERELGGVVDHKNDDCKLDIFQMTTTNSKPMKELVTIQLLDFKRFHIDVKDIKSPLLWWKKIIMGLWL